MIDKKRVEEIAAQICNKEVPVVPHFGPVGSVFNKIPETYLATDINPLTYGYSPLDFSAFWTANKQYNIGYKAPPFLAQFEVWLIPNGRVVNTVNCASVPLYYRQINANNWVVPQNATLFGGGYITFIPKGSTVTDLTGCKFLGVRAYYFAMFDQYSLDTRFAHITNDVFVGKLTYAPQTLFWDKADGEQVFPGFVSQDASQWTFFGTEKMFAVTATATFRGEGSTFGVFNMFSQKELCEDFLGGGGNALRNQTVFAPWLDGYKFNMLSVDGSTERYLTLALAP